MNVLTFLLVYMETFFDQFLQKNSSSTMFILPISQPIDLYSYKTYQASSQFRTELQSQPNPSPIYMPTPQPSNTLKPSKVPSKQPVPKTPKPSFTWKPSNNPTSVPTARPTPAPSPRPSGKPSSIPTPTPTSKPSSRPSSRPTSIPTSKPTAKPTPIPTKKPTPRPTKQPITRKPTTRNPTIAPTTPSFSPSYMPSTINPSPLTSSPTLLPSATRGASVAPTIPTLSLPLSLSPFPVPSTAPVNPSNPSVAPSETAAPTFTQSASPTAPSTSSPSFDANENIVFAATNFVTGVNLTAFRLSSTAQDLFCWCIASHLAIVPSTAVVINSIKEVSTNSTHLRSLSAVAALSIGLTNKIAVTYDVTIAAVSLPSANLTASYGILSRQLSYQVRSGNFTKTLRRLSQQRNVPELTSANSSSISIRGYQIVYSSSASPTQSPEQPKSSDAFYTSWPLYAQILLPVAIFLVAVLLTAIVAFSLWKFFIKSADPSQQKQKQQQRTDDANAMSLSNIYKTDNNASEDKKPNIWNFISIGRPKPYDASKEPGEHKAKENMRMRSEMALVPTVDGDGPSEVYSSPLRRESSPTRATANANLTAAALRTPTPTKQSQDGKKSTAGRSRTTATRENSPMRGSGILRTDSKRRAKGDFTRGDFQ